MESFPLYDLKYCNECCMNYDIEKDLAKIKSKVLIVACKQDPHFPPELDAIPMHEMIKDSELIVMDSELVINQMNGKYKVKSPNLKELNADAVALSSQIGNVKFTHVRRSDKFITRADALLNKEMDLNS